MLLQVQEMIFMNEKRKIGKKLLKAIGVIMAVFIAVVLIYVAYVFLSYSRIEDNQQLKINDPKRMTKEMKENAVNTEDIYTVGTYNVGFGAYLPSFSFFMDGGKYSRCYSAESGTKAIQNAATLALEYHPDFMMFQEVDRDSTRSCHVNQEKLITDIFGTYYETFAVNYDSAYLFYPFNEPIGASYSGISTHSKYAITDSLRRSLPISTGFSKILDLDRCYSINRVQVKNGKELVLYNVHLSAYGNSDEIREGQLSMLFGDIEKEIKKGNYIVCGGDFNHDLKADEADSENCESWAFPFPRSKMPEGVRFAMDELDQDVLASMTDTSRNCDIEYIPGTSYVCTLDGFMISDNIELKDYQVINTGYAYSDHEPVIMKFKLQ